MTKEKSRSALGQDPFEGLDILWEQVGLPASGMPAQDKPIAEATAAQQAVAQETVTASEHNDEQAAGRPADLSPEQAVITAASELTTLAEQTGTEAAAAPTDAPGAAALPPWLVQTAEEFEAELTAAIAKEKPVQLLDQIIAAIDQEVEAAFGPGTIADLTAEASDHSGAEEQHILFSLEGTEYAVSIDNVTEVGRPLEVTPIPNVPDWVLGVANLRGDIISVVDLRAFLGLPPLGYEPSSRMLVGQSRREDMTTGLIVDRVSGIRYLAVDQIHDPAAPIEDQVAPYLRGVYEHQDQLLVVLDFEKLLLSGEIRQFGQ